MTTKPKLQISPKRDAQFRRLAKKIGYALFDFGPKGSQVRLRIIAQPSGESSWMEIADWYRPNVERLIVSHLRRAEIARLRKGTK